MNIQRARKILKGCTVHKDGREVKVTGNNLTYRVAAARNGQVRRQDVDYVKSKMPVTTVQPR